MRIDWSLRRWERISLAIMGLVAVVLGLLFYGGYREATSTPVVVRYDVATAPRGFQPIRIALLSDTHIGGHFMSIDAARGRAIAEQIRELRPDLIVLNGDYAGSANGLADALKPLSTLDARYGVVAVLGNHDYDGEQTAADMRRIIRKAGFAPLVNDHVNVGEFVIAGLDDLWKGASDIGEAQKAIADAHGRPVILVSHNPDVFPQVPPGVALTLAGHTHGAHAVLPLIGTVVSSSRFGQRYRRGLIVENGRDMVVTSGAGGFFFRWNVPPEIALITLRPRP